MSIQTTDLTQTNTTDTKADISAKNTASSNNNNSETPKNKGKKSKKILKIIILTLLFFVVILPLIIIALFSIPVVQRSTLELAPKFIDGLKIEKISGSLQNNLTIQNLSYNHQGVDLSAKNTQLELSFSCLFDRYICIDNLKVSDFSLKSVAVNAKNSEKVDAETIKNSQDNHNSDDFSTIKPLPLGLLVKNLQLENISLDSDNNQVKLAKFNTSLDLTRNYFLDLKQTNLDNLQLDLAPTKEPEKPSDFNLAQLKKQLENGLISSDLQQYLTKSIPFGFNIHGLNAKNIQIKLDPNLVQIDNFELQSKFQQNDLEISKLSLNSNLADLNLNSNIQLKQQVPTNLQLDLQIKDGLNQFMPNNWKISKQQLNLNLTGQLLQQTTTTLTTDGALNSKLKLQTHLTEPFIPFKLDFDSPNIAMPLQNPWLFLNDNAIQIKGNLNDYKIGLKSKAKYQNNTIKIPIYNIDLEASGDLYAVNLTPLKIDDLSHNNENLKLAGKINFYPELWIDQQLTLQNFDLKNYINQSFKLNGSTQFKLSYSDALRISLQNIALTSKLNNKIVSLTGELQSSDDFYLKTQNLTLKMGNNTADLSGILGNLNNANSDFKAIIDAPNLNGFMPNLGGRLKANINLSGYLTHPDLEADIAINSFKMQDLNIENANIKANVKELNNQYQGNISAKIHSLKNQQIHLKNINLSADGTEQKHAVTFSSKGSPANANFRFLGKFDGSKQQYFADFSKFNINSDYGNILLKDKLSLNYNNLNQSIQLNAHCWNISENNSNLCLSDSKLAMDKGELHFNLKNFNSSILNKFLTSAQITLSGKLNSDGDIQWHKNSTPKLNLNLTSPNLLVQSNKNGQKFKLDINKIDLKASIKDQNLTTNLSAKINNSPLSANLNASNINTNPYLNGKVKLDDFDLKIINNFLPKGDKISALLNANINIAGTPKKPILNGDLTVSKLKSYIHQMPFDIKNGELKLNFQQNSSDIRGFIQSNNNDILNLNGGITWQDIYDYKARINAKTDSFYMDVKPYAKLKIKSDITLNADKNSLDLGGFVNIPWGRINIESLPDSAIALSPDAIIVDKNLKPNKIKTNPALNINSNIDLKIGDDVKIDAYGLKGGLTGLVKVKQLNSELGLYGNININNGRYRAFGQDLLIKKGLLGFSGTPSLVYLDITAIRNPNNMKDPNITAGINVTGLADRPKIEVFSTPSMEQQEALSYLLSGSGLESRESSSNSAIGLALLSLSLSKSGKVIGQIGETFGISDLNLSTEGNGDSSQVVISGNITPRLEVKYGIGLFSALAELTLRYRILPKLYLQSVTGASNAVDLIYQFEFD